MLIVTCTVEPLNKGHIGDNINSAVVSFVERLSSLRRFKMYYDYTCIGKQISCPVSFIERSIILCPYLGGSTIRGSTVFIIIIAIICEFMIVPTSPHVLRFLASFPTTVCTQKEGGTQTAIPYNSRPKSGAHTENSRHRHTHHRTLYRYTNSAVVIALL